MDSERNHVIALMCERREEKYDSNHLLRRHQKGVQRIQTFVHARIHEHDVAVGRLEREEQCVLLPITEPALLEYTHEP